jgi:hypothetical protein
VTLVDSNVFLDVWSNDPEWFGWSCAALAAAANRGVVTVNPVIIAELCRDLESEEELLTKLRASGVRRVPLPVSVAWPAAQALIAYRRRGGPHTSPFADFFIGAHALVENWPLLTRDPKRYRTYFPKLKLIAPK